MFASAASSERPRDIFREPALSVGIPSLGAPFAASDDCSQHRGGCAKNFRTCRTRKPKLIWGAQAASLLFLAAGRKAFESTSFRPIIVADKLPATAGWPPAL